MPEYATRPKGDPQQWNFACSSCRDRYFVRGRKSANGDTSR
jgi:hypothetical protein